VDAFRRAPIYVVQPHVVPMRCKFKRNRQKASQCKPHIRKYDDRRWETDDEAPRRERHTYADYKRTNRFDRKREPEHSIADDFFRADLPRVKASFAISRHNLTHACSNAVVELQDAVAALSFALSPRQGRQFAHLVARPSSFAHPPHAVC
jgi:hypothetical protein